MSKKKKSTEKRLVEELHIPTRSNFPRKCFVSRRYKLRCEIVQDSSSNAAWS